MRVEKNEEENDSEILMENEQENTSFENPTHLEICKNLVEILKVENEGLYKNLNQMIEKENHEDTNK